MSNLPEVFPPRLELAEISLKPLAPEDAAAFFEFVEANRPYLERFDTFMTEFPTLKATKENLGYIHQHYQQGVRLSCSIWKHGEVIGYVTCIIDPAESTMQIGYAIAEDHQGRGIITTAVRAILNYGFDHLGLRSARLHTWTGNQASIRVAEKLGFKRDPKLIPAGTGGVPSPQYVYVLARPT